MFEKIEQLNGTSETGSKVTYERFYLPFEYAPGTNKAVKISIKFKSSGNEAAKAHDMNYWTTPGGNNTSGGEYVGSELYIDDVKLIY